MEREMDGKETKEGERSKREWDEDKDEEVGSSYCTSSNHKLFWWPRSELRSCRLELLTGPGGKLFHPQESAQEQDPGSPVDQTQMVGCRCPIILLVRSDSFFDPPTVIRCRDEPGSRVTGVLIGVPCSGSRAGSKA